MRARTGIGCIASVLGLLVALSCVVTCFFAASQFSNFRQTGQAVDASNKTIKRLCGRTRLVKTRTCSFWGVTTTIFDPPPAIIHFLAEAKSPCLVVVGDRKSNNTAWLQFARRYGERAVYLSPEQQLCLPFLICEILPWNHFGRKNVGYMYAIASGASMIYDFDDDNDLLPSSSSLFGSIVGQQALRIRSFKRQFHLFNPYPAFHPRHRDKESALVWPRGFPLGFINDRRTYAVQFDEEVVDNVAVFQTLANVDPDVDAIYRMTSKLPLTFSQTNLIVAVPPGSFVPWNAQATLFRETAFWGLLLPVSMHGRVSDIWRSYITERLLWEANTTVAFTSACVEQNRNPHDYTEDFAHEEPLYTKAAAVVRILAGFSSDVSEPLDSAFLRLVKILCQQKILTQLDADLASAWVKDLKTAGYSWPTHVISLPASSTPDPPVFDFRKPFLGNSAHTMDFQIAATKENAPFRGQEVSSSDQISTPPALSIPVRGYSLIGGQLLASFNVSSDGPVTEQCNSACFQRPSCDAWSLHENGTCTLRSARIGEPRLNVTGAKSRSFFIGLMQKRARVLVPAFQSNSSNPVSGNRETRVLWIAQYHHVTTAERVQWLLENMVGKCFPQFIDVVVIAPWSVLLPHGRGESLINPFSKTGVHSQFSFSLAQARFPGYGGYVLVNDDAALALWEMQDRENWFGLRSWGNFPIHGNLRGVKGARDDDFFRLEAQHPEVNTASLKGCEKLRYWWFTLKKNFLGVTFCRAQAGFRKEFCGSTELKGWLQARASHYCDHPEDNSIAVRAGRSDLFFVSGTQLISRMSRLFTMSVEHAMFLENAVPLIYWLIVPSEDFVSLPLCNVRTVKKPGDVKGADTCKAFHPIKAFQQTYANWWQHFRNKRCNTTRI